MRHSRLAKIMMLMGGGVSAPLSPLAMWIWPEAYNTKAEIDAIIAYSVAHGITDLYPSAIDWNISPRTVLGGSTVANITAYTADSKTPMAYLIQEASARGIRVHAWFVIYIWETWGGAGSVLLTPLTDNATNHSTDSGGSCLNFAQAAPRGTVEDCIADFVTQNPGLTGVNLDYIRTDGVVTNITAANVTAFVSELRAKIPSVELSFCSLANSLAVPTYKQDGAAWLANDYADTMISMGYDLAYGVKRKYWDTCDFTGKKHFVGQTTQAGYSNPSDFAAGMIRYRDLGYENFCYFVWPDNVDAAGYAAAIDDYRDGTIDANTTMGAISKITVTPGTSFAITIGGEVFTTAYADVTDHTTTGELKSHIEAVEGARPFIYYMRPTASTVKIVVGDWEP